MDSTADTTTVSSPIPIINDGLVCLGLYGAALCLVCPWFSYIGVYNHNLEKRTSAETARILAASANVGNGIIHAILVIYILLYDDQASDDPYSTYWQREHELGVGGIAGPLFFTVANLIIGRSELRNNKEGIKTISLIWNTFIAVSGVAIPFVWRRFLEEGLGGWPYPVIFLWYLIFFMESVGVVAVWFHYFVTKNKTNNDDDTKTNQQKKDD